jgi:Rrf2 family protein
VRLTAKADYAVRAAVELAADGGERPVKAEAIVRAQGIPPAFLDHILGSLRQAGIVESRRGADGGHRLARPAAEVTLADVLRAIDGPLASVAGVRPDRLELHGTAAPLQRVWIAVRASLREVLEHVTLADVAADELPPEVVGRAEDAEAWSSR